MPNATSTSSTAARGLRRFWFIAIAASLACSGVLAADTGQAASPRELAALAGPDRNDDGIRDDLEAFVTKTFGDDVCMLRAVQNGLIASRYVLGATDAKSSSAAHSMSIRSSECLSALVREGKGINISAMEELSRMIANTPERIAAMQAHAQRIRDVDFVVNNAPEWEKLCERPVDEQARTARAARGAAPQ
jgi:hypothetical protein